MSANGWPRRLSAAAAAGIFVLLGLELWRELPSQAWVRWRDLWPSVHVTVPASNTPAVIDGQPAVHAAIAEVQRVAGPPATLSVIGNPSAHAYPQCEQSRARNPWDLIVHDGRLYVGLGDASNSGPSANAGPVPVYAYDLASHEFEHEVLLPEEQMDRFYQHEGRLWLPGDDPRQSWRWGNLHWRDANGAWIQSRTLPRTIHTSALTWHRDRLFAGLSVTEAVPEGVGMERYGSAVAVSADGGTQWQLIALGGWRISDFLVVQGQLFAADLFPGPQMQRWLEREQRQDFHAGIYEHDEARGFVRRTDLDASQMFPNTPRAEQRTAIIQRALPWHDGAAYLGFVARVGDEPVTQAIYWARSLSPDAVDVERLALPDGALAMDLRVEGDELQVVFVEPINGGGWQTSLWTSRNGRQWTPVLSFSATAPARSFERYGADWYFGLGSFDVRESDACTREQQAAGTLVRWHQD